MLNNFFIKVKGVFLQSQKLLYKMANKVKIFSCSASKPVAEKIAASYGQKLGDVDIIEGKSCEKNST